MSERFQFAPSILARLGEELVPKPEQGIVELVRNSYDADARTCRIELIHIETPGGTIVVSDDGVGMDAENIRDGWFILGGSSKSDQALTDKLHRIPAGNKGIGRLAALRLGTEVTLRTRPEWQPGLEYVVQIEWSRFDNQKVVEDVPFEISSRKTKDDPGTDIVITGLKKRFARRDVERLARELLLLSNPFDAASGFRAELVSPEFQDLERKVRDAYFSDAEYHVRATLDPHGRASAKILDWRGQVLASATHELLSDIPYDAPSASFELWWFKLQSNLFTDKSSSVNEVREWLSAIGGIHLYHKRLRVRPYGDPGYDWLELNLARARSPEERPSTNNTIGRVEVDDPKGALIQKTDRIGFVENETFNELRRFCKDVLEWLSRYAMKKAEDRRKTDRERAPRDVQKAEEQLNEALNRFPVKDREAIERSLTTYKKAVDLDLRSMKEDLQLYRSLATAGIASATFAHQASRPLTSISEIADVIRDRLMESVSDQYDRLFRRPIEKLKELVKSIEAFASLPIRLLKREKRRPQVVDVNDVIENVLESFDSYFSRSGIKAVFRPASESARIAGTIALIEAIATNFITNSIYAFDKGNIPRTRRSIHISTEVIDDEVILTFADSGLGIQDIDVREIWVPGRTTTPGGTGFGLTIVNDSVQDLAGTVRVSANGHLGGAEFTVALPAHNDVIDGKRVPSPKAKKTPHSNSNR
jgi:signal transduction histidine kinase